MTSKDEVTVKRAIKFSSDTKGSDPQHIPSEAMDTQAKRGSSVINCKPVPEKAPKLAKALSNPLLESLPPYKEPSRCRGGKRRLRRRSMTGQNASTISMAYSSQGSCLLSPRSPVYLNVEKRSYWGKEPQIVYGLMR
jgi:hypothetical protein